MARELLRYRSVDDFYEEWLEWIAELVTVAGGSAAPARSLPRATWLTGLLHHLRPRESSSGQGVWRHGATHHARCQLGRK